MKARTKQKSLSLLLKSYGGFLCFFFIIIIIYQNENTWMSSNKLEMTKCEKFTD